MRIVPLRGWLDPLPLIAVLIWGGVYPGAKLGLAEIPPLSFTSLRLVIAAMVLLVASRAIGWSRFPRSLVRPVVLAGLAQTIFQAFFVLSMRWTTAGDGAVLLATAPLMVSLWHAVSQRAGLPPRTWAGLVIGFAGVVLVVGRGGTDLGYERLLGGLCALISAAGWAWYGVAAGRVVRELGSGAATGWSMAVAAAVLLPLSVPELATHSWASISWVGWAALLYGSIAGPVIAMSLWGRALSELGPQRTMVYTYLEPAFAVVLASWLLGESIEPIQAAGAALALVGVWLATGPRASSSSA